MANNKDSGPMWSGNHTRVQCLFILCTSNGGLKTTKVNCSVFSLNSCPCREQCLVRGHTLSTTAA